MIFHSIRWRLQLWYGVMLVAVLTGFGVTSYQLERASHFRGVDEELQKKMAVLSRVLELNNPSRGGPNQGMRQEPPPLDRPPPDDPPDERMRPDRPLPGHFKLPEELNGNEAGGYYYFIWRRDGTLMGMSSNAPVDRFYGSISAEPGLNTAPKSVAGTVTNAASLKLPKNWNSPPSDSIRELVLQTPPGETLIVGRSIVRDLAELHKFGWSQAGFGALVLLCGLAGGWWLAARAIRPIEDISATAIKIAAGDLSRRIDVADTENELGRLASVLNSTFARLDAAFAQQGRFTADAAHELRTPVSVILTQTQTVLKHERDAADYKQTVEACQRSAQKMRRLLESLLELARLDAGQEPMKQQRFDLAGVAGECVQQIQPLAGERQIKIHNDLPSLECVGDPDRLAQVLTNLLSNAIHYNKESGEVRISTRPQNGSALVIVTDTGIGISAEDLPHVFERFYRADKARSGAAGRNGLGLSISKAIVEAHGGNIEVTSQPGVGTTFTVRLPREA